MKLTNLFYSLLGISVARSQLIQSGSLFPANSNLNCNEINEAAKTAFESISKYSTATEALECAPMYNVFAVEGDQFAQKDNCQLYIKMNNINENAESKINPRDILDACNVVDATVTRLVKDAIPLNEELHNRIKAELAKKAESGQSFKKIHTLDR